MPNMHNITHTHTLLVCYNHLNTSPLCFYKRTHICAAHMHIYTRSKHHTNLRQGAAFTHTHTLGLTRTESSAERSKKGKLFI